MNAATERTTVAGPAGVLACAVDRPAGGAARPGSSPAGDHALRGVAVVCHPHPLHGGTMDNKVAQTLARAFVQLGYVAVRFNFRGVGGSAGQWDQGDGEVDDALAVLRAWRHEGATAVLGGFSFGGAVAARAAARLAADGAPVERLALVAPAVVTFPSPPVPADTVLVHGEHDDVVPLAAVLDWARPQSLPVTVLPGAGHFFHGQLSVLRQLVVRGWPTDAGAAL